MREGQARSQGVDVIVPLEGLACGLGRYSLRGWATILYGPAYFSRLRDASRLKSMKTLAILMLAIASSFAAAQSQRAVFLQGEGRENIMQRWEVASEKWQAQPKWTPASDAPPPLAIPRAVELGETWLRKRHPDLKVLAVNQVTLKAQGESGPNTKQGWFYRIEYQPVVAGKRLWGGEFVAVVLFDGTVVIPKEEPYASSR